jgi:hypothetical protein
MLTNYASEEEREPPCGAIVVDSMPAAFVVLEQFIYEDRGGH